MFIIIWARFLEWQCISHISQGSQKKPEKQKQKTTQNTKKQNKTKEPGERQRIMEVGGYKFHDRQESQQNENPEALIDSAFPGQV